MQLVHLFLQGQGTSEFVIEAHDMNEVRLWLDALSSCISNSGSSVAPEEDLEPTPSM